MAMSEIQRGVKKKKKKRGIEEGEKGIGLDKGERQEGLIRETKLLPERDNERATEDEIKERRRGSQRMRGAYRELGGDVG